MQQFTITFLFLLFATTALLGQEKLNVEGDARIEGVLKLNKGTKNTIIGVNAGPVLTTGIRNTAIGESALSSNDGGSYNTVIGSQALLNNTTGLYNTAIGSDALNSNTEGTANTAIGSNALYNNSTGQYNIAIGWDALYNNSTGLYNNAIGSNALSSNTTGSYNTANGTQALQSNTTGQYNVAFGSTALYNNRIGIYNTAIGSNALSSNTTGSYNTANGAFALQSNSTGQYNAAYGTYALYNNTTGQYNNSIGYFADVNAGDLNYAIAIGSDALTTGDETTVIGRNAPGVVIGGYANWSNLSDGRFKEAIKENVPGLEFISRLRPVTYWVNVEKLQRHITARMPDTLAARYMPKKETMARAKQEIRTGFVAQEVEAVAREIGYQFDGVNAPKNPTDKYSIAYSQFVPSLVKATQEQQDQLEKLENEDADQSRQISQLQEENRQLRDELAEIKELLKQVLETGGSPANGQTIQVGGGYLLQNSPNPFAQATVIDYFLPEGSGRAQLQITDMAGRVLKLETVEKSGKGRFQLRAQSLPAGTYAYSLLIDGNVVDTKKMVISK